MLANFYKHSATVYRLSLVPNTMGAGATETWAAGDTIKCLLQEHTGEEGLNNDQTQAVRKHICFCDPSVNIAERDRLSFSSTYSITPSSRTSSQITAYAGTSTGNTWASTLPSLSYTMANITSADGLTENSNGTSTNSVTQAWDFSVPELIGADYGEISSIVYYAKVTHNATNYIYLGSYDWVSQSFTLIDTDDPTIGDAICTATVTDAKNLFNNNVIRMGLRSYRSGSSHILKTDYLYFTITVAREYEVVAVINPGGVNHHKELYLEKVQRG